MLAALERKLYHWLARRAGAGYAVWREADDAARQATWDELEPAAQARRRVAVDLLVARNEAVAIAQRAKKNLVRSRELS